MRNLPSPPESVKRPWVGSVAAADLEVVDLERVDRERGLLPAALLHRRLVVHLLLRVPEVDVQRRAVEAEVGKQICPVGGASGVPVVASISAAIVGSMSLATGDSRSI